MTKKHTVINFGYGHSIHIPWFHELAVDADLSTPAGRYEFFRHAVAWLPREAMKDLAEAALDELAALELSETEGNIQPSTVYTPHVLVLPPSGDPLKN